MDVNDWDSASPYSLRAWGYEETVVTCSSGCNMRELMSNEWRLLDPELFAVARSRDRRLTGRTFEKCAAPAQVRSCGRSGKLRAV